MADPSPPPTSALSIPPEIQEKFGALLALIQGSESMNNEERQYWINILPVMTPEQIKNLDDILTNEKKQLAAIDEKYSKESAGSGKVIDSKAMEEKIKTKKKQREKIEKAAAEKEEQTEEEILGKIQAM